MKWSFRELFSRSQFRFPPLASHRREDADNRGTGVHANRDFSPPRSRSSTSPLNTSKERAIDRNPESAGSAQIPAHLPELNKSSLLLRTEYGAAKDQRKGREETHSLRSGLALSGTGGPTPNTEARDSFAIPATDSPPRASVNPFIITHPDGSETWLCIQCEEPVKWNNMEPYCDCGGVAK